MFGFLGFSCKGKNGFFPDPVDCARFIRCVDGKRFNFKCPKGLKFNVKIMDCDQPSNVDCGGKLISFFMLVLKKSV